MVADAELLEWSRGEASTGWHRAFLERGEVIVCDDGNWEVRMKDKQASKINCTGWANSLDQAKSIALSVYGVLPLTPVLFLDIDGVLNSDCYFERGAFVRDQRRFPIGLRKPMDHLAVGVLNKLVAQTKSAVVISSAWRCNMSLVTIAEYLRSRGYLGPVIGHTPRPVRNCNSTIGRGRQIAAWLRQHPGVNRLAILDDTDDMAPLGPWLVQVSTKTGLTAEYIPKVIEAMAKPLRRGA